MDTKKHIEKQETEERRPRIDLNIQDAILLVFIVVFVILEHFGGIDYFCGWYNPYLRFYIGCFVLPITRIFLPLFIAIWTLRPFINWTKYTQRKRFIRIIHICMLLVFIVPFFVSVFTPIDIPLRLPQYIPFTYGFRERIKNKADIEDIRNWLKTLKEEDCNGEKIRLYYDSDSLKHHWPDSIEWPESLKVFNPRFVSLDLDENKNPKVILTWRVIITDWGVVIGMENMEIPPSDCSRRGAEYRLPLGSGAYVWHDLE